MPRSGLADPMTKKTYTIVFEHGDRQNQWVAHVREIPQCHTFGRGLTQTRARIREALVLWEGPAAEEAELLEELPMPKATRKKLVQLEALRRKLADLMQSARSHQDQVVTELIGSWSLRDIGQMLAISHQRVGQIAMAHARPKPRRSNTVRK